MLDLGLPGHSVDEMSMGDIGVAKRMDELLLSLETEYPLRCFWVKPDAKSFDYPGRWHIGYFHANPELRQYFAITNPDGSYTEPGIQHFEAILARDTFTGQMSYDKIQATREGKAKALATRKADLRREFREKLDERLRFINNVQIAVPSKPQAIAVEKDTALLVADARGTVTDVVRPKVTV